MGCVASNAVHCAAVSMETVSGETVSLATETTELSNAEKLLTPRQRNNFVMVKHGNAIRVINKKRTQSKKTQKKMSVQRQKSVESRASSDRAISLQQQRSFRSAYLAEPADLDVLVSRPSTTSTVTFFKRS
jgi:intracellular sulfur oxidation DsrE/DsrF family protein